MIGKYVPDLSFRCFFMAWVYRPFMVLFDGFNTTNSTISFPTQLLPNQQLVVRETRAGMMLWLDLLLFVQF